MNIKQLEDFIINNANNKDKEFKRLFHGRGEFYEDFEYLLVDSINDILFVTFFKKIDEEIYDQILDILKRIYKEYNYSCLIVQKRYLDKSPSEIMLGSLKDDNYAYEFNLKYKINLLNNQNFGFFPDMKVGHNYVLKHAKDKKVLNLFSYTCAFSVCAMKAGALKVVNVDMSSSALNTGRLNHRLNNLDTKKVKFMPHNILKSWNAIKKEGPYDLIIIDPPSFQKGSFAATKDYEKIIKRLNSFASSECVILSCLNAPELDTLFIKELFSNLAPEFEYIKRLDNLIEMPSINSEKSLKNLIFKKT